MYTVNADQVEKAVASILSELGDPYNEAQIDASKAFAVGCYERVRRISVLNLADNYCKSLSYLGSAFKLLPNTDTILAEAARAAAEFRAEEAKRRVFYLISQKEIFASFFMQDVRNEQGSVMDWRDPIKALLDCLGEPETADQEQALEYLWIEGESSIRHNIAVRHPECLYCRAVSHLAKSVMFIRGGSKLVDPLYLHEASLAIADFRYTDQKKRSMDRLSSAIAKALED